MIPLQNPTSHYEEDYHRHDFYSEEGTHLATIEFDAIDDEGSGKLFCELAITPRNVGDGTPVIVYERVNLLNRGAAKGWLMSSVAKMNNVGSLRWEQGLDTTVTATIRTYRELSSEGGWLDDIEGDADSPYLLRPFIAASGTTVLYGPHGQNKSMLALKLGLSIASGRGFDGEKPTKVGPVLYVDMEDAREPHAVRYGTMRDALGIKRGEHHIWHERVKGNLRDAKRRLRRLVREHGFVLIIVDSIGLARNGDVSGSELTIKLFKMFNQMGAAVLALDHMTKEDQKRVATGKMDAREATPIGSQFTQSSARLAWFISTMPQSTPKKKLINLYNSKHNHTPQHEPVGLIVKLDWDENDSLTKAEFHTESSAFEALVTDALNMTKAQELLVWHFKQQREDGHVIPMRLAAMGKSGVNPSTISSVVTSKNTDWWEQIKGSKEYTLTPLGLELAMLYQQVYSSGVENEDKNG